MILPITLTMAGGAGLLSVWLGSRTSRMRRLHKVSIGDGGNPSLLARMRAHSNFVEYTPFFLILLALIEMAIGAETWLWLIGALFLLARIAHAFGLDRPGANALRVGGITVTLLILLGLSLYAIALPYLKGPPRPIITYAASPAAEVPER